MHTVKAYKWQAHR